MSILSYNAQLERSLYSASHSSIVIQKKDGSEFEHTSFENSVYEYEFVSKLEDAKVVSIKQGVTLDSLPEEYKNVVSVVGTNNTSKHVLFRSGVFTLTSGKDIDSKDKNSILIHSDLAKKNHLKVGDTIVLNSHTYTIKGIFVGKKHETYTGLSSDLSENTVFVDYHSLNSNLVNKMTVFSRDKTTFKQVQSLYPSSEYVVSKDTNAYQSSLESVQSMKHMIQILSFSIIACGLVVLSLVLVLWLRDRIHEIGILLSIGKSKMEIIVQFILELVFISLPLGIVVCVISLVFNQVSSFLLSYGLLMSIIIVSVLIASLMIMIKKPREILSKLEEEYFNKSIPVPSMIVDSGRGLYLIWLIEQVPSKAVSLWSAMQHYLYDKLKSLGADRQALDPSRILRVIGSYNTKSNTNVKLLRFEFVRYTLKKLKEMYLPKVTKKLETKKKAFKRKIVKFFNIYSLYKARIDDLEKLAELRGYDLEGKRELILFLYRYYNEILEGKDRALELTYEFNNKFIKPLPLSEVRSSTKSNYIGKYNYKNSTLVELLDISKDEMEYLSSMVTEDVKYERNNERRKRNRRNEDGLTKREAKKRANLIDVLKGTEDKISTKEIAETGQSFTHCEQPIHFSLSTIIHLITKFLPLSKT